MAEPVLDVYYCATDFDMPSPEAISRLLSDECNIIYKEGVLIVRVSPSVVVKFGPHVKVQEAKNMIYVALNTNVPLPTVFACYTYGPIDRDVGDYGSLFDTYIFMSAIDGDTLHLAWDSYNQETKTSISSQLKTYVDSMRSLEQGHYIGSIDDGPVMDPILDSFHDKGPFGTEENFNNALVSAYEESVPGSHARNLLSGMLSYNRHRILFSHGDLWPGNIMVKDGKIVSIIDWEMSGWYPEYWEFVKSLYIFQFQNDWYDYLVQALQPYYAEYAFHSYLAPSIW